MGERKTRPAALLCALASGLLVFFAIESAVARRVGLDLFLPVWEGAFLPGRVARLAACLVGGLALCLTERGKKLLRALDRFCGRDRGRWAISAVVTGLFFAWALRVTVLCYMTMDDVTFLQAIAQVPEKGLDATAGVFSSQLLSWFLGKLYGLDPDGYWYLGYHLVVLLASLTVIGRCILVRTSGRGWPAWTGCAVHGILCAGLFLYCFAAIAFTVTPAVAGTAAAALVLCRDGNKTAAGRAVSDIAAAVLLVLCILQRRKAGLALLCFWALAVGYQLLRMLVRRAGKKQTALFAGVSLATFACVWSLGNATIIPEDPAYNSAEYYRSRIVDYLNNEITLEQYEQAGVSRELGALIHGWCFMDEQVTTDLFRNVIRIHYADEAASTAPETASPPAGEPSAGQEASDAEPAAPAAPSAAAAALSRFTSLLSRLTEQIRTDGQMSWRIGCVLALGACCIAALLCFGRRYWLELLAALCCLGGMAVLLLYLVEMGRFPLRVFLVVSLPAAVLLCLLALTAPADMPAGARRITAGVLAALGGAAAVVCCAACAYLTPYAAEAVTHDDVFAVQSSTEQFAFANRDKLIISNVFDHLNANTDPFHRPSDYPDNIVQWGYCGDTAKDPADRLYADAFFRDDVLLMSENPSTVMFLLQYLTLEYGPVQAQITTRLAGGIVIYDISQISPGPDYTGWYEQDDMTYYFRDGQALTGEQIIDGESCTFAPIGADSQFLSYAGDSLIYLTDAYSLVTPEADTP